MARLYYGLGDVTIEGHNEIRGVQIQYKGNIRIEKTASDNFVIKKSDNQIILFPIGEGFLNKLFIYEGNLTILSVISADNNAQSIKTSIKKVMDYSELLTTKAENITINSENLSAGKTYKRTDGKLLKEQKTIDNLTASNSNVTLYLIDGSNYNGYYHIHLDNSKCMTGSEHTESSQDLYFKQIKDGEIIDKLIPTENSSHIPPALNLRTKRYIKPKKIKTDSVNGTATSSGGGY